MSRFSSKSSLLAGVSALVLATAVSSGAVAQALTPQTFESNAASNVYPVWASGAERTTDTTAGGIASARSGDNLTILRGAVYVGKFGSQTSRPGVNIGTLKSGESGVGTLVLAPGDSSSITINVNKIVKKGSGAINVEASGSNNQRDFTVNVRDDAEVNILDFSDNSGNRNRLGQGKINFNVGGDLITHGATKISGPAADHSVTLELKGHATFGDNVTFMPGYGDNRANHAYLVISGDDDQTIGRPNNGTAQIKAHSDGDGVIKVQNGVQNGTSKVATFDIQIGHDGAKDADDKRIGTLKVGDATKDENGRDVFKGGHAIFKKDVHVNNIEVIAGNHADEKATVEFRGNVTGTSIKLDENGGGSAELIIGHHDGINQSRYLDGAITVGTHGEGTVTVDLIGPETEGALADGAERGFTFKGKIGERGKALGALNVKDTSTKGVTFKGKVYARSITVDSTIPHEKAETEGVTFEDDVVSDTSLILRRNAIFKGNVTATKDTTNRSSVGFQFNPSIIGAGNFPNGANVDPTATFDGRASDDSAVAQTVKGAITTAMANEGRIRVLNSEGVTFENDLGTSNAKLDNLTLTDNAKAIFKGSAYFANGSTLGNGSSVIFNGRNASGTAIAQTITGNITSADGGNYGAITVANTHANGVTFAGSLGASGNNNALASVTLNNNTKATFQGNVYLNGNLSLDQSTKITFGGSGDQQIAATITNGGNNGRGDLVVNNTGGTVTFAKAVGATGGRLNKVELDRGAAVFNGGVHANTIKFGANATATSSVTFGGNSAQSFANAITTDAPNRGAITVTNTHTNGVIFRGDLGAGNAKLASLTLNAGAKATLEKSGYFNGTVSIGDDATLIIGDASTVTSTNGRGTSIADEQKITGNIVGQGSLEIRNRSTHNTGKKVSFSGSIGAEGAALDTITVADGETTFNGDIYASNLNITTGDATTFKGHVSGATRFQFGASNDVTFSGDKAQTITGDITRASGASAVNFTIANGADVTFAGQLGDSDANQKLNNLTVNQNAKVTFNEAVYLSGTLTLNTGTTIALGSGLTTRTDATQAFITAGSYSFGAGTYDDDDSKVKVILPVTFTSGTQTIFSAHNSLDKSKFTFAGNNLVNYKYNFSEDGTAVTVTAKGFKSPTDVESAAFSAVKSLPDSSPIKKLLQEAAQTGNEAKGKTLAEQLKPQTTALSGAATAVVSTGTQVAGVFTDRLSVLRGGETLAQRGFATGGHGLNKAFWLKPFGSWGKQTKNTKQNVAGYSTTAKGLAVGVDAPVTDKVRVGTALAYSTSNIKGKGAGKDNTDVKSWQVSLYGDYSTARYYVEGQLGLGRNDVSTASKVAFLTRKADYDTTSVTASVGGGVPLNLNATTTLTPTAGLAWTRVGSANYTTTGASVLNQKISVAAIDAVVGTLGTQLQRKITRGAGTLVPTARVGLSYDFAGKPTTASGKFTGGGDRFKVKGAKVKKLSGTAGLGLTYAGPRWSIGADYDLTARTGYQGHTARVSAKVKF